MPPGRRRVIGVRVRPDCYKLPVVCMRRGDVPEVVHLSIAVEVSTYSRDPHSNRESLGSNVAVVDTLD